MRSQLLIGLGQHYRRDDAAGLAVAAHIEALAPEDLHVARITDDVLRLVELLRSHPHIVVVDAMRSGSPPGTLKAFHPLGSGWPQGIEMRSSHTGGLPEALRMLDALGEKPRTLTVYGIEGRDFSMGEGLSPEVEAAVRTLSAGLAGRPSPLQLP